MNKTKAAGIILITVGFIFPMVSLFADFIGVGDVDPDHFTIGFKQMTGMMFGAMGIVLEKEITKKISEIVESNQSQDRSTLWQYLYHRKPCLKLPQYNFTLKI